MLSPSVSSLSNMSFGMYSSPRLELISSNRLLSRLCFSNIGVELNSSLSIGDLTSPSLAISDKGSIRRKITVQSQRWAFAVA